MSDFKNIDNLIKKGIKKEYPVDEQLWSAAQNQLDTVFPLKVKKLGWVYAGATILIATIAVLYFLNSGKVNQQSEVVTTSNNQKGESTSNHSIKNETLSYRPNNSSNKKPFSKINNSNSSNSTTNEETISSNILEIKPNSQSNKIIKQAPGNKVSDKLRINNERYTLPKAITTKTSDFNENVTSVDNMPEYINSITENVDGKNDKYQKPQITENEEIGFMGPKPLSQNLQLIQPKIAEGKVDAQYKSPIKLDWFVGVSTGIANNKNSQFILEGLQGSSITHRRIQQTDIYGGITKNRWSASIGFGQVLINNQVNAARIPKTVIDTISMSYRMVEENVVINGRTVSLIERQFNTSSILDSNNGFESVTQQLRYLRVPLRVSYKLPINRFEIFIGLGSDVWFAPKVRWNNFSEKRYLVKSTHFAPQQLVICPNADVGLGYRVNSRFTCTAMLTKSITSRSVLVNGGNRLNLTGLNLALNYRL